MTDQLPPPATAEPSPAPASPPTGPAVATAPSDPGVGAPPTASAPPAFERLNLPYHLILGVAMGVVAVFTGFAWIPAVLTGIVIGRAGVEQRKGIRRRGATQAVRILAVTGGVFAMLIAGAIIGGIIAFLIVALAAFSERVAENAGPTDQTMSRIIIGLTMTIVWFAAFYVIGLNLSIKLGG